MTVEFDKYKIEVESSHYVLSKTKKNEKTGEDYQDTLGYFVTMDRAVHSIVHDKLASKRTTTDLKGFLDEYRKIKGQIEKAINIK